MDLLSTLNTGTLHGGELLEFKGLPAAECGWDEETNSIYFATDSSYLEGIDFMELYDALNGLLNRSTGIHSGRIIITITQYTQEKDDYRGIDFHIKHDDRFTQ